MCPAASDCPRAGLFQCPQQFVFIAIAHIHIDRTTRVFEADHFGGCGVVYWGRLAGAFAGLLAFISFIRLPLGLGFIEHALAQ